MIKGVVVKGSRRQVNQAAGLGQFESKGEKILKKGSFYVVTRSCISFTSHSFA